MAGPEIFTAPLPKATVQRLADEEFGNMVKFVVDLKRRMICAGGGLHSDEEQLLLEDGSAQQDLWGANFYLDRPKAERIRFTSMINIRPNDGNTTQEITRAEIRTQVAELARHFFQEMP